MMNYQCGSDEIPIEGCSRRPTTAAGARVGEGLRLGRRLRVRARLRVGSLRPNLSLPVQLHRSPDNFARHSLSISLCCLCCLLFFSVASVCSCSMKSVVRFLVRGSYSDMQYRFFRLRRKSWLPTMAGEASMGSF